MACAFEQCLRQFEGDPGAAQFLAGISASWLVGVEHGDGLRNFADLGQVMIGHDEIYAHPVRGFGGGKGANAGIHADDQTYVSGGGLLNDVALHAVSVFDAVGHVKIGLPSAELNGGLQDHDSHGAIHVVIAVDQHGLALRDGALQALHCRFHAPHQVRRVQLRNFRMQKCSRLGGAMHSARDQELRNQQRQPSFGTEL